MGYYQGDHYRSRRFAGDYYRGDPGFFSFIGSALKGLGGIVRPKGTELVTSRRMNVGNARALRRALRRARGFAKLAHKVLRATHQFKGKGFGRAKTRRR